VREALPQRLCDGFLLVAGGLGDIQPQHDHMGQITADFGQHLADIVQRSGGLLGNAWADRALVRIHPHLAGQHDAPTLWHLKGLAEAVLQGVEYRRGIDDLSLHDASLLSVGKQG